MSTKQKDDKHVVYSVKVSPDQAAVLDKICETIGVNSYQMFQMFAYTMARAAAPQHELDPRIRKVMTMMETDASWAKAFNLANPNELDVAQVVLILQQKDKRGFGAVMIDKPFMGEARMTECTDDILERVCEVTMHGIYRRLRLMGGQLGCNNLSDVLLDLIERRAKHHRTGGREPHTDERRSRVLREWQAHRIRQAHQGQAPPHTRRRGQRQQRIVFTDEDREVADEEVKRDSRDNEDPDDMEKEMGFRPHGEEW